PEWPSEIFQSSFTQMEPNPGQPSAEKTAVAVQYDDKNIYVAFICHKSYPDAVIARETRRDQLEKQDDVVSVVLDTYHDSRSAFWFMANALNSQVDARIDDDGKSLDTNWDAGWEVKTAISDSGWTAEFAIPFKSLRFNPTQKTWGANFGRFVPKRLETSYWAGETDNDFRVSKFGVLTGLKFPRAASELRFIPYTTLRYETFSSERWNNMTGLDLEYRYRNNITANLTFNPDFATVEGDRERINMTRWELSFPEKRKFFLEGGELFQSRITPFYSRRIGEINFGGKAIGKTGPYTFAVIGVNARKIEDNPLTSRNESFPEYNLGVVRLKRDVLKSSTVGLIMVDKEWHGSYNRVLGLDGVFNLPQQLYFTTQFVVGAPGPFHKNYGGFLRLARENNIYHYHLRYTEYAENFKASVNGVGFITDDNRRELDSAVEYKWWIKKSGIEFLSYESNYNAYWAKTDGTLRSWEIAQEWQLYLTNKFSYAIDFVRDYQLFEKGFHNYDLELSVGYNTEEWSSSEVAYQFGRNFDLDYWMATGETRFKIHDRLSVELELRKLHFNPDPDNESTWLNIATLNYQFTPDLFVRLFTQHRTENNRVYIYGLFGWRFKLPNSAIYLVYTRDDFDRIGLSRMNNELFFLKLAYDFSF
ncbi:MAG: carbohydrate binding family 9 domain-containing protein, partial [candidate division KSB1 bacterium]|nr:carbohydrate binding family 9 domain-containing protein [candidate division KSB1 bacterium]